MLGLQIENPFSASFQPRLAITIPPAIPPIKMTTALTCQTLKKISSVGSAAFGTTAVLPATCDAINDNCSGVKLDIFGTPIEVFAYSPENSDPLNNPFRKKLVLTASDYPNALGVKGAYQSRYKFTCQRFYGETPSPRGEFLDNLLEMGRKMEPVIFNRWNLQNRSRFIATRSGLLLDQVHPETFGATPDGLVWDVNTHDLVGTLEIKYRPSAKSSLRKEDIPQKYKMQMLGQLMCLPVHRWFYIEMDSTGQTRSYEGYFTQQQKDDLRRDLIEYLYTANTYNSQTFPRRCKSYPNTL